MLEALRDENTFVVAQVAPSVRVGLGGHLGFAQGENSMPKVVGALKALGFDRVFDTVAGADMTVVEEAAEFLSRLEKGEKLPLFTSCCPAWMSFCAKNYPQFADNLSTCRSPQQMLGAVIRHWWKTQPESAGKRLVSVSFMPCTAKKAEILRPDSITDGVQDVDYSVTTSELLSLLEKAGINAENCPEEAADAPFASGSGASALFGMGGGVTEAVLRYLGLNVTWQEDGNVRQASFCHGGREVRIATVSGLANAAALLDRMSRGEESFDFVEVMACPGGCVMGGGQPSDTYEKLRDKTRRDTGLHAADSTAAVSRPEMAPLWRDIIGGQEHQLLHRPL